MEDKVTTPAFAHLSHPKATQTLSLKDEKGLNHRTVAKIDQVKNHFSWALETGFCLVHSCRNPTFRQAASEEELGEPFLCCAQTPRSDTPLLCGPPRRTGWHKPLSKLLCYGIMQGKKKELRSVLSLLSVDALPCRAQDRDARRAQMLLTSTAAGWSSGFGGMAVVFLTQKRGHKVSGAGFAAAQPHPAHVHGWATMEQLLEDKRACEKCSTETKSRQEP